MVDMAKGRRGKARRLLLLKKKREEEPENVHSRTLEEEEALSLSCLSHLSWKPPSFHSASWKEEEEEEGRKENIPPTHVLFVPQVALGYLQHLHVGFLSPPKPVSQHYHWFQYTTL